MTSEWGVGAAMAANLSKAGHDVAVCNRGSKIEPRFVCRRNLRRKLTWRLQMKCNLELLRIPSASAGVIISICLAATLATATAKGTVATIVADQVRSQGFTCKNPSSAERIDAESTPNQTVYLLKCEDMTYHVLLIPDQAADVARVD
ncbi:NAD(P)-binding domain-containing protein [Mesorhizobium sp. M1066]|uniref:hypothetical protein n=1 Tax=unclassified Mesorhizobium TaxID=325217 RepID=UPI00333BCD88